MFQRRIYLRVWLIIGWFINLACLDSSCFASGSTPRLNLITPRGVQRGHEHWLRFSGERLDKAEQVFLYDEGIAILEVKSIDPQNVDVKIRVDEQCRIGEHIAQIRTAQGISDFRSFFVGVLPDVQEAEPNNTPENAQAVELDCTINGTIKNEDVDWFRLECRQGQRLSVEIEAIRLGFMFDSFISVLDENNFEIAVSDDSSFGKQDGVISLKIPRDGTYYVAVRESSYGGNNNARYRLHVGQFPRPTVVFPPGGLAGATQKLVFLGDAEGEIEKELRIENKPSFRPGVFVEDALGVSPSPVAFRTSSLNNALEVEPNDDRKSVSASLPVPCALNGIIQQPNDMDYFKFSANKGQAIDVELLARRIRSGLDPVMNIFNAAGKHLVGDDDARRPDCYLRFNVPETGDYFLRVRDHLNRGKSDFVYRVELKLAEPELTISIPRVDRYSQLRQKIAVAQGNRFATMVSADRKNFGGPIELLEAAWPPGVTLECRPMVANMNLMPVVFSASEDAPISGKLVDLRARHTDASKNIEGRFSLTADFALGPPNNAQFYTASVNKLACAVTKKLPFKIEIEQPQVPLVRNGTMNLKITAIRDEGFDQAINVQFPFRPPGLGTKPQIQIKKGETSAIYPLNANGNAQLGKWPVYAVGQANVNGPAWVSTQLAEVEISEPLVTMEINRTTLEQGQEATVFCKVNHHQPFEGEATAEILGLPPHIDIPKLRFTTDTQELNFTVSTNSKSRIGKHKGMFCRVTIFKNDEPIVSTAARSELRINKPKPKEQNQNASAPKTPPKPKTAQPKPKSRLQQLREAAKSKTKN